MGHRCKINFTPEQQQRVTTAFYCLEYTKATPAHHNALIAI